jgi:hypothetical protein
LSIGLTEEEEMDTYTVICIDGPGKDDDPVPLPDAREPEVGDVVTLHGAEYKLLGHPSSPVGGTPGERPLSPNEIGPQALQHDSRRYIAPRA